MAQHTQDGGAGDAHLRRRMARHLPDAEIDAFLKLCENSRNRYSLLNADNVYKFLKYDVPPAFRDNPRRATAAVLRSAANEAVSRSRSAGGKSDEREAARVSQELMKSDATRHAYDEWLEPAPGVPFPDFDALPYVHAVLAAPFRLLWHVLVKGPQVAAVIWFWTKVALLVTLLTLLWRPLNDLRQWWRPANPAQPVAQTTGVVPGGAPPGVPVAPPVEPGVSAGPAGAIPAPAPVGGSSGTSSPVVPPPTGRAGVPPPARPPESVESAPPAPPQPVLPAGPGRMPTDAGQPVVTVPPQTLPADGVGVASPPVDLPPVHVGGNVPRPRKTWNVTPDYPRLARLQRVEGIVILEVHVDPTGAVQDAIVLRSVHLLDEAVVEAVRQWRYEPTVIDGRPRAAILTETVSFP